VLVLAGQLQDARCRFKQSLAIAEKLAKDNPSSAEAQRDLIVSYAKLAQVTSVVGWWKKALTLALELERTGLLAPKTNGSSTTYVSTPKAGKKGFTRADAISFARVLRGSLMKTQTGQDRRLCERWPENHLGDLSACRTCAPHIPSGSRAIRILSPNVPWRRVHHHFIRDNIEISNARCIPANGGEDRTVNRMNTMATHPGRNQNSCSVNSPSTQTNTSPLLTVPYG